MVVCSPLLTSLHDCAQLHDVWPAEGIADDLNLRPHCRASALGDGDCQYFTALYEQLRPLVAVLWRSAGGQRRRARGLSPWDAWHDRRTPPVIKSCGPLTRPSGLPPHEKSGTGCVATSSQRSLKQMQNGVLRSTSPSVGRASANAARVVQVPVAGQAGTRAAPESKAALPASDRRLNGHGPHVVALGPAPLHKPCTRSGSPAHEPEPRTSAETRRCSPGGAPVVGPTAACSRSASRSSCLPSRRARRAPARGRRSPGAARVPRRATPPTPACACSARPAARASPSCSAAPAAPAPAPAPPQRCRSNPEEGAAYNTVRYQIVEQAAVICSVSNPARLFTNRRDCTYACMLEPPPSVQVWSGRHRVAGHG